VSNLTYTESKFNVLNEQCLGKDVEEIHCGITCDLFYYILLRATR